MPKTTRPDPRVTALAHAAADEACGRPWTCACTACRTVRGVAPCTVPGCDRAPVAHGLCPGHYAQRRRGVPLSPLRHAHGRLGAQPLVQIPGLRVSASCAAAVRAAPGEARAALEEWAKDGRRT